MWSPQRPVTSTLELAARVAWGTIAPTALTRRNPALPAATCPESVQRSVTSALLARDAIERVHLQLVLAVLVAFTLPTRVPPGYSALLAPVSSA